MPEVYYSYLKAWQQKKLPRATCMIHMDSSCIDSSFLMMFGIPSSPMATSPLSIHWRMIFEAPLSALASWFRVLSYCSRFCIFSLCSLTLLSFSLLTASMTYSISNWSRIIAYVLLLLLPALRICTPRPLVAKNMNKYRNECWLLWRLKKYLLLMLAELPNAAAISGSRSIMRSRFSAS